MKHLLIRIIAHINLSIATRKANKQYAKFNKRFYVMPNHNHKLIVISRQQFRKLRTKAKLGLLTKHEEEQIYTQNADTYHILDCSARGHTCYVIRKLVLFMGISPHHQNPTPLQYTLASP